MDRVIDLDQAAAAIVDRQPVWQAAGLTCALMTWRDASSPWPHSVEADRSKVRAPDSLGIHMHGPDEAELVIVLYCGGWADVDYIASMHDAGTLPALDVTSAEAFGSLLDACVTRVFGLHGSTGQGTFANRL